MEHEATLSCFGGQLFIKSRSPDVPMVTVFASGRANVRPALEWVPAAKHELLPDRSHSSCS